MHQSLLIDKNYMVLSIVSWKKAVKLLVKDKAEPLDAISGNKVKTGAGVFVVPSIIKLVVDIPFGVHIKKARFKRKHVMTRDQFRCQYCNAKIGKYGGTIDHVIPKSKGGKTSYTNCVACCKVCNNKKADHYCDDIGMKLLNKPKTPGFAALYTTCLEENLPEEWLDFIKRC